VSARVATATFRLPSHVEFLWQYINLTPMAALVQQAPASAKAAMEKQFVAGVRPYVVDGATVVDQPMVIATGRAASSNRRTKSRYEVMKRRLRRCAIAPQRFWTTSHNRSRQFLCCSATSDQPQSRGLTSARPNHRANPSPSRGPSRGGPSANRRGHPIGRARHTSQPAVPVRGPRLSAWSPLGRQQRVLAWPRSRPLHPHQWLTTPLLRRSRQHLPTSSELFSLLGPL
jgi:hypothetical protein